MKSLVLALGLLSSVAFAQVEVLPTDKEQTCVIVVRVLTDAQGKIKATGQPGLDCETFRAKLNPAPKAKPTAVPRVDKSKQ